jgi:hypothetical protein
VQALQASHAAEPFPDPVILNSFQDPGLALRGVGGGRIERISSPAGRPWIIRGKARRDKKRAAAALFSPFLVPSCLLFDNRATEHPVRLLDDGANPFEGRREGAKARRRKAALCVAPLRLCV